MKQKRGSVTRGIFSFFTRSRVSSSRRGQVTVFIIIGILILFVFSGALYLMKKVNQEEVTDEGVPVIASVPQEFQPIKAFTENCLSQTARRGLDVLGQQGGYIYPNLVGKFSSENPTDSDGINLEPLEVPYWHYNQMPNKDPKISYASLKPYLYAKDDPEGSIETQLSGFTKENLYDCINNYAGFTAQGYKITASGLNEDKNKGLEVKSSITDSSVNVLLTMEVKAEKGDAQVVMEQFVITLPIRLKHYYEVASEIADVQKNYNFLELQALDLLSTYSSVKVDKLPPMDQLNFDSVPTVSWTEGSVKDNLKNLLVSDVPMLRYLGSTNFYRYEFQPDDSPVNLHELFQKNYDDMIIPLETAKNVEISFDYFGWEPYFDMNDANGQIIPSTYYGPSVPPIPAIPLTINHYYSTYDISYPVLITIRDPSALQGRGYTFSFALEANIRNNNIPPEGYVQPKPIAAASLSMVCDKDKRNTQPIKAVVVDSADLKPLEAVQIGFSIPEQDDCVMGQTDRTGQFESAYPGVYGGVTSFIKSDYLTNYYPVDTYNYKDRPGLIGYAAAGSPNLIIPMHKRKFINVSFEKKSLEKCIEKNDENRCFSQGLFASDETPQFSYSPENVDAVHSWIFPNIARSLSADESATITLRRVGDVVPGIFSNDFAATASVKGNTQVSMELYPGIYAVSGLLTSEQSLVIPEEERCTGGVISSCFDMGEQVLDKMLIGQLRWDAPQAYLKITPEQLYSSDHLTFTILSFNLAAVPEEEHLRIMEDLQMMGQVGDLSQKLRSYLEPEFS